ncbi:hypothetical protein [Streptomyces catenulae]|uniref:Uncharacterized protein n=1 Tax=Streptomyces catenulae TaxID=66875 RepID=A0ABV2Z2I5_9ACTN|nr:hypothetical protein [Streptomyces catenulae]
MTTTTNLLLAPTPGEHNGPPLCVRRGGPAGHFRLSYTAEQPGDRDLRDVLWDRTAPDGQRQPMLYLNCALCEAPVRPVRSTSRPRLGGGMLFLVPAGVDVRGQVRTVLPPVCLAHATIAARESAALQHGHTALLVTRHRLHGVIGTRYRWAGHRIQQLPPNDEPVAYGTYEARWTLARLLVRELTQYSVVDLDGNTSLAEAW